MSSLLIEENFWLFRHWKARSPWVGLSDGPDLGPEFPENFPETGKSRAETG